MIFKLNFSDKTEYVQDKSQLDLIRNYQSEMQFDIYDLNEITEISEEQAKKIMLSNNEYNNELPEDDDNFKEFSLWNVSIGDDFCIIGSTEWDQQQLKTTRRLAQLDL